MARRSRGLGKAQRQRDGARLRRRRRPAVRAHGAAEGARAAGLCRLLYELRLAQRPRAAATGRAAECCIGTSSGGRCASKGSSCARRTPRATRTSRAGPPKPGQRLEQRAEPAARRPGALEERAAKVAAAIPRAARCRVPIFGADSDSGSRPSSSGSKARTAFTSACATSATLDVARRSYVRTSAAGLRSAYNPSAPTASRRLIQFETITCPYCWESIEITLDLSVDAQQQVEDCSVCCRRSSSAIARKTASSPRSSAGGESRVIRTLGPCAARCRSRRGRRRAHRRHSARNQSVGRVRAGRQARCRRLARTAVEPAGDRRRRRAADAGRRAGAQSALQSRRRARRLSTPQRRPMGSVAARPCDRRAAAADDLSVRRARARFHARRPRVVFATNRTGHYCLGRSRSTAASRRS